VIRVKHRDGRAVPTRKDHSVLERAPCEGSRGRGPCETLQLQMPPYDLSAVNAFSGDASTRCAHLPGSPVWVGEIAWRAVVRDDLLVPSIGFVKESRMAEDDLATMHQCNIERSTPTRCCINSSDWNMDVALFRHFLRTLASKFEGQRFSQPYLHLEFEYCLVHYYRVAQQYELPEAGDLVFAAGRWIADCPHAPVGTELHPVIAMAHQRLEQRTNSEPITVAHLWVNGFFTGEPFSIDLYPPPRPSPNAFLILTKPRDADVTVGMSVAYDTDPDALSHVRVTFSGAPRTLDVRSTDGFVEHHPGRVYRGKWTVGWYIEPVFRVVAVPPSEW